MSDSLTPTATTPFCQLAEQPNIWSLLGSVLFSSVRCLKIEAFD
jgi:hypothetical protein